MMLLLMLAALVEQQPLQEDDGQDRQSERVDVVDLTTTTSSSCRHYAAARIAMQSIRCGAAYCYRSSEVCVRLFVTTARSANPAEPIKMPPEEAATSDVSPRYPSIGNI